ncbi:MAG: AmmeMemoRadiSam system radical SAM enzyme [Candidatus Diapherotrites archaeon]|nr:AmmeMemoRadiSam system radical SAM enzyme [Candidatus Diapherotrites archaeon]
MKEAQFYSKKGTQANCFLCGRRCSIAEGKTGFCRVRKNLDGKLYSLVYGKALTLSVDPIEKKPFYNFMPGSFCTSISTYGCNFSCKFCQNHGISQDFTEGMIGAVPDIEPEVLVERSLKENVEGISYTYVEPTIFAEYALDTMKIARKKGLYNVWVSNGYMSKEAIGKIAKNLDAINIDLKGDNEFYKKMCGNADMDFVMDSIRLFHKKGVHVEVTNLIVPGFNDLEKQIEEIVEFIASVDKRMPLHFSRFFPHYKMPDSPVTPAKAMEQAYRIAKEKGLSYVYLGNFDQGQNTVCPSCGKLLIERHGYSILVSGLDEKGKCVFCGARTGIIMAKTGKNRAKSAK